MKLITAVIVFVPALIFCVVAHTISRMCGRKEMPIYLQNLLCDPLDNSWEEISSYFPCEEDTF